MLSESGLVLSLSDERLRRRMRWAGALLSLSFAIPFDAIEQRSVFLGEVLLDLSPVEVIGALAPMLVGLFLLAASRVRSSRRVALLSLAGIALLLLVSGGVSWVTGASSPWDLLPMPESWTAAPGAGLLALPFAGVSLALAGRAQASRARRRLKLCAVALAILYYIWPVLGEPPGLALLRVLRQMGEHGIARVPANLLLASFLSWPLLALWMAVRSSGALPAPRAQVALVTYPGPALLVGLIYRSLSGQEISGGLWAAIGSSVLLLSMVSLVHCSLEHWVEEDLAGQGQASWREEDSLPLPGLLLWGLGISMVGNSVATLRSNSAALSWPLGPASEAGSQLFGRLIPQWNDLCQSSPPVAAPNVSPPPIESLEQKIAETAASLDPRLPGALGALMATGKDADLTPRRWTRRVSQVNEVSRQAGLPFYVDPTSLFFDAQGNSGGFHLQTYRIESIQRFRLGGGAFASLRLRALRPERGNLGALGISRDLQPYAILDLDELALVQKTLEVLGSPPSPACLERPPLVGQEGLAHKACGYLLQRLVSQGSLGPALIQNTERHELQHQWDGARLPRTGGVLRRLGSYGLGIQTTVNRELSGYLAEMTTPGTAPQLALVLLFRHAFAHRQGIEHETALLTLEALSLPGERFGGPAEQFLRLVWLSDEELRSRARRGWARQFGWELPTFSG